MKTTEITREQIVESIINANEQTSEVKNIMTAHGYRIVQAGTFIVEGRKNGWDVIITADNYCGKLRARIENHFDAFSYGKADIINTIIKLMEANGGVRVERLLNAIRELDARVRDILEMVGVADR